MRNLISYLYQHVHNSAPKNSWSGSNGVVAKISEALNMENTMRKSILGVLEDVLECKKKCIKYDAKRKSSTWGQDKLLVQLGLSKYNMIGRCMEDGNSLTYTLELVNELR